MHGHAGKIIGIRPIGQNYAAGIAPLDLQPVPHPRMHRKPAVNMVMGMRKIELCIRVWLIKNRNSILPPVLFQADLCTGHRVAMSDLVFQRPKIMKNAAT